MFSLHYFTIRPFGSIIKEAAGKFVTLAVFVASIVALLIWYQAEYAMEVITSYSINDTSSSTKVLIASQGSDYKEEVVANVLDAFYESDVYVQVIDVTKLSTIEEKDWDAIVVIHTWELWKPQMEAAAFLSEIQNMDNVIVLATSGDGDEQINGIDGMTSASVIENSAKDASTIVIRIKNILQEKYARNYTSAFEEY